MTAAISKKRLNILLQNSTVLSTLIAIFFTKFCSSTVYRVLQLQNKKPHCTKRIIVPVVPTLPAKFSGIIPGIIYHLQY